MIGKWNPNGRGIKAWQTHTAAHKFPQASMDVTWLISMLTTRPRMGIPTSIPSVVMPLLERQVFFEQWYHKVWCQGPLPSSSHLGKYCLVVEGAMADTARYMGPTTSVGHILHKLLVIFGTVVLFNVLMPNFYKVSQGSSDKVPSFATRLEGTLNQIQLQCPRRMMDLEAQQHLRDHLFHAVRKHIHGSVEYLYSTHCVSYSQLMVAAQKTETQDQVRLRAMVTTEPVEGMAELKQQIVQLMAALMPALTQAGWGNSHSSTLSSPQECGLGFGQSGGGSRLPMEHRGKAQRATVVSREIEDLVWGERVQPAAETPSLQCYRCQG